MTKRSLILKTGAIDINRLLIGRTPSVEVQSLSGVKLNNELLIDDRLHFITRRNPRNFTFESIAVDRQPIGHGRDLGEIEVAQHKLTGLRSILDCNFVTGFHVVGSYIHSMAIHQDVTVRNKLASGASRIGQPKTIHDVVDPRFQELKKRLTSDTALP